MAEEDDQNLEEFIKKRSRLRAVVSRYITMTERNLRNDDYDKLLYLRKTLIDKSAHLDQLNESVHELIDENDLTEDINNSFEYDVRVRAIIKEVDTYFEKKDLAKSHDASNSNATSIKLLKLELPKFSGNKLEFGGFWDMFETAVLNNTNLTKVQKFAYLMSCLTGEAKLCLSGLSLNGNNFELALEILTEKFGNKDSIIREHLKRLQNSKCPNNNPASLKQFMYDITMHSRCLNNMNVSHKNYETMLMPILLQKLPDDVRLRLLSASDRGYKDIYTVDGFTELLYNEIVIREECKENVCAAGNVKSNSESPGSTKSQLQDGFKHGSSAVALPTFGSTENRSKGRTTYIFCVYCDSNEHLPSDCQVVHEIKARVEVLKQSRRCFICLRKFHNAKTCRGRRKCRKCFKYHHISICPQTDTDVNIVQTEAPTVSLFLQGNKATILPSAKAILCSPTGEEIRVRLLLDQCSTRTFIRSDVCDELGIKPEEDEQLAINTFGSENAFSTPSGRVQIKIKKIGSADEIPLTANKVETICSPQPSYKLSNFRQFSGLDDDLADEYDHRDVQLPISILIGADFYYDIVTDTVIRGNEGPVALSSRLGWLASGVITSNDDSKDEVLAVNCYHLSDNQQLSENLKEFWSLEHLGVTAEEDTSDLFLKDIYYDTESLVYSVKLPWKIEKDKISLNSNFDISLRRLNYNLKRLRALPHVLSEYERILQEQLVKNIIEPVPDLPSGTVVHYLPHHPVIKPEAESTKVRIVLDASSKSRNGFSLNDCMHKGPCLLPQIPILLTKFRLHNIAILADIEKAFLQIAIDECDRDALRILWVDDPTQQRSPLKVYRYKALIFGLKSSPAILEHVIRIHLEKFHEEDPDLISKLSTEFYVDNLISGVRTVQDAKHLFLKAREIFAVGHFNLRQWKSNHAEFLDFAKSQMNESVTEENEPTFVNDDLNPEVSRTNCKVLGVPWDNVLDEFIIDLTFLQDVLKSDRYTKRELLQITSKVYDPLGFLCPVMILPKLLFQKVCGLRGNWDADLDSDVDSEWREWLQEISRLVVKIRRCTFDYTKTVSNVSIHGFSDASSLSYSAAIYMRISYDCGKIECFLLMAKSRIVPKSNPQTIPRLELMGSLILARLIAFLKPIFMNYSIFCWCDSRNVICWITQEHKIWKTFIQNRVLEIRKLVPSSSWHFLPGVMNPSDIATRPVRPSNFHEQSRWLLGPEWLYEIEQNWPHANDTVESINIVTTGEEVDKCLQVQDSTHSSLLNIIDVTRYSSYFFLLRVIAYMFRIAPSFKRTHESFNTLELSSSELNNAEVHILLALQNQDFAKEINHLHYSTASTNLTRDLRLFIDENGLLRSRGRLSSCLTAESNCPIVLPRSEHFSIMIVNAMQEKVCHNGVSATLAKLREKFWLLRGRQVVKRILRRCVWCNRVNGLPYQVTHVPALPAFRVERIRAFHTVGLDYCGPLKYGKGESGQVSKSYICLFSCASTRALHLELVPNMSTEGFLRALRRFISRRGIPAIVSDNFSSFKKAFKDLNAVTLHPDVKRLTSEKRIQWKFIVERAPWQGGFYERLVKEIKDSLKKTLKFSFVDYEELRTIITEIEAVLNSRPICYVSAENEEVITPSHFLTLKRLTAESNADTIQEPNLLTRLKTSRILLERFWRVWSEQYLNSLRERSSRDYRASSINPTVGDVVLIKEEKPRLLWKMGKIECCKEGRDGAVRSATVRVMGGGQSPIMIRRPIRLLIPLEFSSLNEATSHD